jgi:hypothetical protein
LPHISNKNRIIRNKKNQKDRKIKKEDIIERKSKKQNKGKERNKKESMQTCMYVEGVGQKSGPSNILQILWASTEYTCTYRRCHVCSSIQQDGFRKVPKFDREHAVA